MTHANKALTATQALFFLISVLSVLYAVVNTV
jgi:hypothetical protein